MNDNAQNRTIWVGNLANEVTEELLYELFLQAGPLERVKIPKKNCFYGFVTYQHEISVPYSVQLFQGITLFNRQLNLKPKNPTIQSQPNPQEILQRSFSYTHPNEPQHTRFNESGDMPPPPPPGTRHISYEDLLRLGNQMMCNNYADTSNNYGPSTSTASNCDSEDYHNHDQQRDKEYDRDRRARTNHNRDKNKYYNHQNNRNNYRRDHDHGRNYRERNGNRRRY